MNFDIDFNALLKLFNVQLAGHRLEGFDAPKFPIIGSAVEIVMIQSLNYRDNFIRFNF